MARYESQTTTDHQTIRDWAEKRGGKPARIPGNEDTDILRIKFNDSQEDMEELSWDEFFEIFDEKDIQFLYQEETQEGKESRFFKFIRE